MVGQTRESEEAVDQLLADGALRFYAAGEADVQALLLVRRQALEATTTAQAARAEALRARYRLQVDAGLLWPVAD